MSATTMVVNRGAVSGRAVPNWIHVLALETWYELLKLARLKMYVLPTLLFPAMFYLLFGIAMGSRWSGGSVRLASYLIATYGAFGVMGASLFGLGVGLAVERGQGWLQVKRATPMPLPVFFVAKTLVSLVFSAAVVAILFALGAAFGGVRFPLLIWVELALVLLAGAVPFCGMGLLLGYVAGPNSAAAVTNVIYLPMAFCTGLWLPITMLPTAFQRVAPWLPSYHSGQLALTVIGGASAPGVVSHLAALAGFTALFGLAAGLAYRRDEGKTYG
jgi:ABC-2 type transport system permease protein